MSAETDTTEKKISADQKAKKLTPPYQKLLNLADSYLIDLECLREMFSTVIPVLQEQDRERKDRINKIIDNLKTEQREEGGKITINLIGASANELIQTVRKLTRAESLFRRESIVSLVSRFDEFFGSLLRIVLQRNPEWLKTNNKTLTYKELIELKSVEKAITGVIEKEVDELMRGSKEEQIDYIDSKLKLGIRENFNHLPELLETAERRNLFAHTGGRVSQQFLDKCGKFKFQLSEETKIGKLIAIDDDYFNRSFERFFEAGLRISQAVYRRLFPEELDAADKALNHLAIKFLNSGDWYIADVICDYYANIPEALRTSNLQYYYFALINRAIAQKGLARNFEKGLQGVHWDSFHPKYKLAVSVLRDNFEEAGKLMRNQAVIEEVTEHGFRTWPLFRDFRESAEFKSAYFDSFGNEYSLTEKDLETEIGELAEPVTAESKLRCNDGVDEAETPVVDDTGFPEQPSALDADQIQTRTIESETKS